MTSTVDRTFVINFRVVPNKLKYSEISEFIVQKLSLDFSQIKHLQISNGKVFVGTDSPQLAQDIVQEHNMKHQLEQDGKSFSIPISMEDGSVEVRVHDLRPNISNRQLAQRMREYGEIYSIREEVWKDFFPGVPNGVKALRMKLNKPIPSYITVETQMTLVTYKGQVATCKHCNRNVHYTQKCSDYAKSLKSSVNDRLSMADIVKSSGSAQSFVEPRRKDRTQMKKQAIANLSGVNKSAPQHSSNTSLAGSEISLSSAELMNVEFPPLIQQQLAGPSSISSPADTIEAVSSISPPCRGFPDENNQNISIQQQPFTNNPNVKRPGSPLYADGDKTEKRRPEIRADVRAETRSTSRSKKH